ncbi:MAG: hypothetical protein JW996_00215 [Candidatus Cloacimonetes bacterium]|nr:hypothetical protein [Candidatus Cloacimonadota bacterium]
MRIILIVVIIIVGCFLKALEKIEINFFNDPEFDFFDFDLVKESITKMEQDSVMQVNIMTGKILAEKESDIFTLAFLNISGCQIACPTDYPFRIKNQGMKFSLLASNISCDTLKIDDNIIVGKDTLKIGIFSIYSPDFAVKNDLAAGVKFNYDVFNTAYRQAKILSIKTDYVIMLSNLSRDIDEDIVSSLPIDAVLSFDYLDREEKLFRNGRTKFYSCSGRKGRFGKLIITKQGDMITEQWQQLPIYPE